jgi:hypothetical protein
MADKLTNELATATRKSWGLDFASVNATTFTHKATKNGYAF